MRRRGQPTAWYTRSHSVARCASLTGTTEKKTTSNIFACCSSYSLIVHLVQVLYYKYLVWLGEFSLSVLQFPSLCRFYTNLSRQEHNWWFYNSKLKMSLAKTYFQPRLFCWSDQSNENMNIPGPRGVSYNRSPTCDQRPLKRCIWTYSRYH